MCNRVVDTLKKEARGRAKGCWRDEGVGFRCARGVANRKRTVVQDSCFVGECAKAMVAVVVGVLFLRKQRTNNKHFLLSILSSDNAAFRAVTRSTQNKNLELFVWCEVKGCVMLIFVRSADKTHGRGIV